MRRIGRVRGRDDNTISAAAAAAGNGDTITIGHNGGSPYLETVVVIGDTE